MVPVLQGMVLMHGAVNLYRTGCRHLEQILVSAKPERDKVSADLGVINHDVVVGRAADAHIGAETVGLSIQDVYEKGNPLRLRL